MYNDFLSIAFQYWVENALIPILRDGNDSYKIMQELNDYNTLMEREDNKDYAYFDEVRFQTFLSEILATPNAIEQ